MTILAALTALGTAAAWAEAPAVRAVSQKPNHCGVACVETVLRAYGDQRPWTGQTALAAALCARLPEFKWRRPAASDAIESDYPVFKETYQPELAELLIDRGYCVISTRSSIDTETKAVLPQVSTLLREHMAQGHPAIIHLPGQDRERFVTLHRHAESNDTDLTPLSMQDLIDVVTAGPEWERLLQTSLTARNSSPDLAKSGSDAASPGVRASDAGSCCTASASSPRAGQSRRQVDLDCERFVLGHDCLD